ncbi:MAG TPA: C40 family peptidase [Spirochaetia bacterium]|nr:C40 family peptidase [Spirochaetia bacterium]
MNRSAAHSDIITVDRSRWIRVSLLAGVLFVAVVSLLPAQAVKAAYLKTSPARAPQSLPARVIASALSYLGVPYVSAGDSRDGMDCSGFVYRVYSDTAGSVLSRSVLALYRDTVPGSFPLHIGDLLFFDTTGKLPPSVPSHVGIYIGGGRLVHAASEGPRVGVTVSRVDDPYYRERLLGVRRALPWRSPVLQLTLTDQPVSDAQLEPFPSHQTVTLQVSSEMSGGGPVSLSLRKDGQEVLSRWISPGGPGRPAQVQFVTDVGSWTVHISRIFHGRTLADVAFSVVE